MKRFKPFICFVVLCAVFAAGAAGTVKIGETEYESIEAAYTAAAENAVIVIHTDADGLRLTSDLLTISNAVTLRGDGSTAGPACANGPSTSAATRSFPTARQSSSGNADRKSNSSTT